MRYPLPRILALTRYGKGLSLIHISCRLRDVVDLFRDTGIGKEGYSLIGQGRIDELLSAKSEDRRQIFEEAAGIVKYKVRKAEAQKRMENTRDNLSRVEDIIAELEGRVEPLRQQSETAREYLQLREELKGLELNAFLLRTERYTQRIGDINQTLEGLRQAQEEASGRQLRYIAERDGAQEALASLEDQAAAAREAVQRLIREVEAREGAAGVLQERIAAAQRDQERLTGQLAAAREMCIRDSLDTSLMVANAATSFHDKAKPFVHYSKQKRPLSRHYLPLDGVGLLPA